MTTTELRVGEYVGRLRSAQRELVDLPDPLERALGLAAARLEASQLLGFLESHRRTRTAGADEGLAPLRALVAEPTVVPSRWGAFRAAGERPDDVARAAMTATTAASLTGPVPVGSAVLAAVAAALTVLHRLGDLHGLLLGAVIAVGSWAAVAIWRSVGASMAHGALPMAGTWTWAEELATSADRLLAPARAVDRLLRPQVAVPRPLTDRARSRAQAVVAGALFVGAIAVASIGWTVLRTYSS